MSQIEAGYEPTKHRLAVLYLMSGCARHPNNNKHFSSNYHCQINTNILVGIGEASNIETDSLAQLGSSHTLPQDVLVRSATCSQCSY